MAVAQTEQLQRTAVDQRGLDISIRTGSGVGGTLLSAFDSALHGAGVADFNLVTLSSVIPTGSRIRSVDAPLPGGHGDLLFCVRAEGFADRPGEVAWAGLGWCVDGTGGGLFVEHHGASEQEVVDQIEVSLADMNTTRGGGYGPVSIAVASARCVDQPVCALVLAAYRVSTWHESSNEPRADEPIAGAGPVHPVSTLNGSDNGSGHGSVRSPAPTLNGAQTSEPGPTVPPVVDGEPGVRVSVEKEVDYATARRYYDLYRRTFGDMETQAVARQLLHESEFLEEMLDPRVQKYIAWDAEERAVGMSTLTSDLETVPWISPGYFAHHYPDHTARGAVFYMGFTLVDPAHRGERIFHAMIRPMIDVVMGARGVVAWDMCLVNQQRGLHGSAGQLLEQHADVSIDAIDQQTYYAATFHGSRRTAAR